MLIDIRALVHHIEAVTTKRLYRTELGDQFNEGARLLWLALLARSETQADIKKRLGCSAGRASRWLYGVQRPGAVWIAKIEENYGVPAISWGQPPSEQFSPPAVEYEEEHQRELEADG